MSAIATRFARPRSCEAALVLVLVAALAVLLFVGRWERSSNADLQNSRMAAVYRLATSGGLVSTRLDRYRLSNTFDCLAYHAPGRPATVSTFELCFDPSGRLVETIDRRTDPPHFASLIEAPGEATLSVPVHRLLAAFAYVGAFRDPRFAGVTRTQSRLPVGYTDIGLYDYPKPRRRAAHGRG